jgi:hypothetical protein
LPRHAGYFKHPSTMEKSLYDAIVGRLKEQGFDIYKAQADRTPEPVITSNFAGERHNDIRLGFFFKQPC